MVFNHTGFSRGRGAQRALHRRMELHRCTGRRCDLQIFIRFVIRFQLRDERGAETLLSR